ncbi:TPM domain-containing protein [Chitinophaga rhizophila]|uniref:TPM domain-containing protein n=1 Tax=Chitinophaga rhizophila TaxID=2866212 RepID=A0ABS7GNE9_9BACT|nr:TPM domain-containing protein [Chitinophaga rhizophila]MBW8688378.1 TPM domain-containing protein [Chitinophaga rhizophila]
MSIFPFSKKELLTEAEKQQLVQAIRESERLTSGEIRLYVESRCKYVNPMERAKELFLQLGMEKTKRRNGVILYIALKDRQFAILGDKGIHEKVGTQFWVKEANLLISYFTRNQIIEGLDACIREIGESLCRYFPFEGDDENELPDDIVIGR